MSFHVVATVLRESDEKLARRLILIVLAEAADDDGIAWIDQDSIAAKARLSRAHVARMISEMDAEKVIQIRKAQRGRRRISVYRVNLPGLDDPVYDRLPFTLDSEFTVYEYPAPSADDVGSAQSAVSDRRSPGFALVPSDPPVDPSGVHPIGSMNLSDPPKLVKVDGRDLAFDALAEECGVDPSGNRAREVGIALSGSARSGLPVGIRALAWRGLLAKNDTAAAMPGEAFEHYVAIQVREKARAYRASMKGAMLTPIALAKWWTDLDRKSPGESADAARIEELLFGGAVTS